MGTTTLLENYLSQEENFESRIDPGEVIHAFFERFGSCIIHGCEVNGKAISPGLVALAGLEAGKRIFRIVRFGGADNVSYFPVYLALQKRMFPVLQEQRIASYYYEAVLYQAYPGLPYLRIDQDGGREFIDALRDASSGD